jgi:hypothetical protein
MWHDTWTFGLDDTVELLTWLHDVLPALDQRVEPVVAGTRLPDVPLHDGTARPDGTVLLLHTTVMADSDDLALALLTPLQDGPLAARSLGHVQGRTSVAEENVAQMAQNPEGYRYAVDCTWTDAPARVLAPMLQALWSELETEHSFSIWYGWAPRGPRPDMAFSVEANVYVAIYVIYTDPADDARYTDWVHRRTAALAAHGAGVYLGDTDFIRRQDRFLSDDAYGRLAAVRAERDPSGRFASYLTRDPERLNVHGWSGRPAGPRGVGGCRPGGGGLVVLRRVRAGARAGAPGRGVGPEHRDAHRSGARLPARAAAPARFRTWP